MNIQEQSTIPTLSCFNCQHEISNVNNCLSSNNDHRNQLEEKETERVIIASDMNSGHEYQCLSCSSINNSELISLDTRKLWQEVAHTIKCVYRETNREFSENHSSHDICRVKQYIQILTQLNAESLFNKIEMIALEYVNEIRNQILKRFHTCFKTSNDVQLFISYLLDEYNTFIQAAQNVSTIISYLEEHYMVSFLLTWLLYNKYLYEKLVYTDKKIQLLMSTMIDLLQPTNDLDNDYSPADYTQLLNRFLAFDEEMSEVACLNKDCQTKMNSKLKHSSLIKRNQINIMATTKRKKASEHTHEVKHALSLDKDILNSSTTNVPNLQSITNISIAQISCQNSSNGLPMRSNDDDKQSLPQSSCYEYLREHDILLPSFRTENLDDSNRNNDSHKQLSHEMFNDASATVQIERRIDVLQLDEHKVIDNTVENLKTVTNEETQTETKQASIVSTTKSESNGNLSIPENKNLIASSTDSSSLLSKSSLPSTLIVPPKPLSSSSSKLAADLRPLAIPLLTKVEIPKCPSLLSTKIQSVSFTAGTFGSITANEPTRSSSHNQKCSKINLSHCSGLPFNSISSKPDTVLLSNNLNQSSRPVRSTNEISTFLSSFGSLKTGDELRKSSFNDKDYDYCCSDVVSESDSSISSSCVACMPFHTSATLFCNSNQREVETKERLKLKLTKRTIENTPEKSKILATTKSKTKQYDNDIDDLVRFIDGTETLSDVKTSKRSKKKKNKRATTDLKHEDFVETKQKIVTVQNIVSEPSKTLSKRKTKTKLTLEEPEEEQQSTTLQENQYVLEKQEDNFSTVKFTNASVERICSTTAGSIEANVDLPSQSSIPPEEAEEITWITISRKQAKHKTPSISTTSSSATPIPSSNAIQQKHQRASTRITYSNNAIRAQPKVISKVVTKNNNKLQKATSVIPSSVQSLEKTYDSREKLKKVETISAWNTHKSPQIEPLSTVVSTGSDSIHSSSLVLSNQVDNTSSFKESLFTPKLDPINYSLVQQSMPLSSFARDPSRNEISRCIQRPSSKTCSDSFPLYSPRIQTAGNWNLSWTDSYASGPTEYEWTVPHVEHCQTSTISSDFPLYDPFNSGAGLNILPSRISINTFEKHLNDLHTLSSNDIDAKSSFSKET